MNTPAATIGACLVAAGVSAWMLTRRTDAPPTLPVEPVRTQPQPTADEPPAWRPYDQATIGEALASGKKILLVFTQPNCLPCEVAKKSLPDTHLWVELDITQPYQASNKTIAEHFGVTVTPTIWELDPAVPDKAVTWKGNK